MEDKKRKVKRDWFINNLIYFVIILVASVYLFTAIFELAETGKNIQEILMSSALILIVGYSITALFDIQGIFKGNKSEKVTAIEKTHEDTVTLTEPYANKLDEFCENESQVNLKQTRTRFLARAGLSYDECFKVDGSAKLVRFEIPKKPKKDKKKTRSENKLIMQEYINKKKNIRFKRRMFKSAIRVKLTQLVTEGLISNGKNNEDKYDLGPTQQDYLKKSNVLSLVFKAIIAITYGYFTIELINDFSWGLLLWNALQIVTFLAFGIIKYFQAYMFMQNDYVSRIKKQINILKKFLTKQKAITSETYLDKLADDIAKRFETEQE